MDNDDLEIKIGMDANKAQESFAVAGETLRTLKRPRDYRPFILAFALIGLFFWWRSGPKHQPNWVWWGGQKIHWTPETYFLPNRYSGFEVELGFRDDGTVLWRPKQQPK